MRLADRRVQSWREGPPGLFYLQNGWELASTRCRSLLSIYPKPETFEIDKTGPDSRTGTLQQGKERVGTGIEAGLPTLI